MVKIKSGKVKPRCYHCRFRTSVNGFYTDYDKCGLTGTRIRNRHGKCFCIVRLRRELKEKII